jgi:hypothetical protein
MPKASKITFTRPNREAVKIIGADDPFSELENPGFTTQDSEGTESCMNYDYFPKEDWQKIWDSHVKESYIYLLANVNKNGERVWSVSLVGQSQGSRFHPYAVPATEEHGPRIPGHVKAHTIGDSGRSGR